MVAQIGSLLITMQKTVATSYWPAIIAYRKDLHAVINLYRNNNVYPRITNEQANRLHGIIEDIIKGYEDNAEEMTPEVWFKCIEEEYGKHLCDKKHSSRNCQTRILLFRKMMMVDSVSLQLTTRHKYTLTSVSMLIVTNL